MQSHNEPESKWNREFKEKEKYCMLLLYLLNVFSYSKNDIQRSVLQ